MSGNATNSQTVKRLIVPQSEVGLAASNKVGTMTGGPSPKKIKLEEKPAPNNEIDNFRKLVIGHKRRKMKKVKQRYQEHLTELFYLQGGGNITEFNCWKKKPTQPLLNFLDGSKLDSEDEENLPENKPNEIKNLTALETTVSFTTPVAVSTTHSPSMVLSQQAINSTTVTTASLTKPAVTVSSELQQHLSTKNTDVKPNINTLKTTTSPVTVKSQKSTGSSPGRGRHSISSVYETVTGGSQDIIVERAKQEAQVLQRVAELRKEGLWSAKRLPRVQEPPRQKAHWDYLLEEMTWLAADFIQERKWKKAAAKKISRMVSNHFKELEQKELRAEKEEAIKLKKIASQMAKMVKEFWTNIEKVVQYKQTTRLEEKKKKALDLHLSFIVDQTEKYSSWLTAGLQSAEGSATPSIASDAEMASDVGDAEFQPTGTASDDEETIAREEIESGIDENATKDEIEALKMESELPLEELLKTLPKEMLDKPSSDLPFDDNDSSDFSSQSESKDQDFDDDGDDEDAEETIDEQEKHEKIDYSNELNDLKAEGEMTVEELMSKYAGAYDSDFDMPEQSSEEEGTDNETSESEKESSEEEVNEPSDDEGKETISTENVGLEYLVKKDNPEQPKEKLSESGPGQEYNDIAAAAQSLQPKGYTLETTEVKTRVPFLLKHTMREYQHVGLDWLATMHEKRLNGILADEMGLGKTIQTIALLAHLACDKGIWGPHLIVVPTSVMLNWEMELKKWCPAFKILTYYGSIKERKLKRTGWTKTNAFHVCITSYKLVVQDHQAFRRKKWKYFILDEAQNIKNFKSQRWQMLLNFSSQRRLLLTGTPLQNSLMELWSLMHFLMPNVFQSHSEFKEWFSNPLTGMVEGSQEYNESLVRRLHKVLRPFLLRRLKNEVEKQMPQKYEHVVMCRLSKRQRYLYDDFMAQSKTKETLAGGHFMSVINILMQLRKVCNHPNLFDPRPIISPFKMEGIVYKTASLVTKVLEYDPFKDIDVYSLYPNLADMETDLPAFVARQVKQVKAPGKLIEEVDDLDTSSTPLPVGELKNVKAAAAAFTQIGKVLPLTTSSSSQIQPSPPITVKTTLSNVQSTPSVNSIKLLLPPSSSSSSGGQQTILIPNPSGSGPPIILPFSGSSTSSPATSTAIASAKLLSTQLQSGVLQLVQTSSGHQILTNATSTSTTVSNGTSAGSTSNANLSLLKLSTVLSQSKPVMRVSPFVVSTSDTTTSVSVSSQNTTISTPTVKSESLQKRVPKKPMKRSELFLESLLRRRQERRQHVLSHMAKINHQRCDVTPMIGEDVHEVVDCMKSLHTTRFSSSILGQCADKSCVFKNNGYVNCLFAQTQNCNHDNPDIFWRETKYLQTLVKSPEEWLTHLQDMLARFVFVTPSVISPAVSLRVSHPSPSSESNLHWLETRLRPEILKSSALLHPIQSRTSVTFPELRLIQYDCGKLQTLDRLLRQLKSGQHRVLIFTQMTKMLDVLEAFLNFHGHRYLRLDGTTRVEQRQYLMDRFNADPKIFCFILSTRSGGVGVNLTGADTVVFYDSDWNPTMDAQAQDRCHRIGQTRDVHIYRLVSEMTVEENILKKANQKRLLGDLAIEGGNFTTAFFKEQTINDLFAEPSGLHSLAEDKEREKIEQLKRIVEKEKQMKESKKEKKKEAATLTQFEQALCKAEDETDAQAAQLVKAEQKAELAEFDENIPWDEREAELRKERDEVSQVEMELAMIDKELTPIERYAIVVIEGQMEHETAEELKNAEEDIEASKKDWELTRLKNLKEEEERKAELEDDEMLYIYSKDESQVKKKGRKPLKKKTPVAKENLKNSEESDKKPANKPINKCTKQIASKQNSKQLKNAENKKPLVGPKSKKEEKVKKPKKEKPEKIPKKKNPSETKCKGSKSIINGTSDLVENTNKGKKSMKATMNGITTKEVKIKVEKVIINENGKLNPVSLQNGTSPVSPSKVSAKTALLKKQAREANHITISSSNVATIKSDKIYTPKVTTPKSPPDPNIPPAWSNPNLVIRTRKAAVHSPVIISQAHRANLKAPVPIMQHQLNRPRGLPVQVTGVNGGVAKLAVSQGLTVTQTPQGVLTNNKIQGAVKIQASPIQIQSSSVQFQTSPLQIQSSPVKIQASPVKIQASPVKIQASPVKIQATPMTGILNKIQSTPDRNIFQIFQANSPGVVTSLGGVSLPQNIRHVGPVIGGTQFSNQIRTATLINPASLVNTSNLNGPRLITTGLQRPSVVGTVAKSGATVNVVNSLSNFTIVPTLINSSGQTVLNPGSSATIMNAPRGARAVLNTSRVANPITLQGLGSLPVGLNLLKTNTGLSIPIRPQQLLQTTPFAAQVQGQTGYVLITPRGARAPNATVTNIAPAPTLQRVQTPISIVQTLPVQNSHQTTRVLLTGVPAGATIVQAPKSAQNVSNPSQPGSNT